MNTITYASGKRVEFPKYEKFLDAKNVLKEAGVDYVSYYDRVGDTHICQYKRNNGGVEVCGIHRAVENAMGMDRWKIHDIAAEMVKEERWIDFVGWSL